jgi:hypothetical protein
MPDVLGDGLRDRLGDLGMSHAGAIRCVRNEVTDEYDVYAGNVKIGVCYKAGVARWNGEIDRSVLGLHHEDMIWSHDYFSGKTRGEVLIRLAGFYEQHAVRVMLLVEVDEVTGVCERESKPRTPRRAHKES